MKGLLLGLGIPLVLYLFYFYTSIENQSPRYVQIAHKITQETGKQIEKEKGLVLAGTGGGMMDDIQMMAMGFDLYHEVSLKEARELVVYATEKYLENINAKKEIRAHLHNSPFTAKNIEIRIWISNPDRSNLPFNSIKYISGLEGRISYYSKVSGKPKLLLRETYEEALEIVNNENNPLTKAS